MNKHKEIEDNFDVVKIDFPGKDDNADRETIKEFMDVGVNWWLEFIGDWRGNTEELRQIINKGPPNL